jgi:phytoene desaturase
MFLDRYATYAGSDPRRAPSVLAVIPYVEHTFRGWQVAGGMHRIAAAVEERARLRGVVVETGVSVVAISRAGNRVDGVRLSDGRSLRADVVVSDVDARQLYTSLLPHAGMQRQLRRTTPSSSGFVVLLGLRGRTPGLRRDTVLFAEDYDAEFDGVFGRDARPIDEPTIYISASAEPTAAPAGHEGWFVLVTAPRHGTGPGEVDWDAEGVSERYARHLLGRLAARGLDVRDRVAYFDHRSPADIARDTASPGGAIYGSSSNGWRSAFLRPGNASPVAGLFLVGGSAHPGGGIPLVLMSAAIVADLVGRP